MIFEHGGRPDGEQGHSLLARIGNYGFIIRSNLETLSMRNLANAPIRPACPT
jgi:hypothetical protein